jgi:hypothetical protein
MFECERCHLKTVGYELFDYCAVCCCNLCPECMNEGCCGSVPALSGMDQDYEEEENN